MTKINDLRVWWIPQVPSNTPFYVPVKSISEAKILLSTLASYDIYQLEHNIKPDFSNAGGLQIYGEDGWEEWYDEYGCDIDETQEE